MFQLIILGLIVIGAALGWIYYNKTAKNKPVDKSPEANEEGKVIYLFGEDDEKEEKEEKEEVGEEKDDSDQ